MKILPIEIVREADAYTIAHEPIPSIELMERAANSCYKWIRKRMHKKEAVSIICGTGNNGGDGLVIARLLAEKGFHVQVTVIRFTDKSSADFQTNYDRLDDKVSIHNLKEGDEYPTGLFEGVIIDAILGSGLTRPLTGWVANLIREINKSEAVTIAIDIPSGLFSDLHSDHKSGAIIKADYTLTFQFPKLAFMFPENEAFVGEWQVLPIGLHPKFVDSVDVKNYFILKEDCRMIYRHRSKFSHKGHYGHALLIAGSYGKMGASVLAARACLKSGVGLLHSHVPQKGYQILQSTVPEAMVSVDEHEDCFSKVPDITMYNAIGIGPGIGFARQTQNALKLLIQNSSVPIVFDADALTILGENKTWISFVPKLSIFTPHPKEFARLAGSWANDFERNKKQREFSVRHGVYVVLKGAHTAITCPDGSCFFNSTGNPGMATAGSGDVLTGIILSLLAQHYPPKHACILGVYLHGLAGDLAAKKFGFEALTAESIIEMLGKAFKKL